MTRHDVAIIGTGNIATDLMMKIKSLSGSLNLVAMAGIDASSVGLAAARRSGLATTANGVDGLVALPEFTEVRAIFDATSAGAHRANLGSLEPFGVKMIDLTPAAVGPFVVPSVNIGQHVHERVVNMVTCGGQATVPIVAAISAVTPIRYAEIVASISSRSAGPGTRANIDEFTQTTARALEIVGGAARGKAIIVLNPAEPPLTMRDTVICMAELADADAIRRSVNAMVAEVAVYVPGYRLKHKVQMEPFEDALKISVFLQVEGAGHHLPRYAGNLDIMTSAAMRTGEKLLEAVR